MTDQMFMRLNKPKRRNCYFYINLDHRGQCWPQAFVFSPRGTLVLSTKIWDFEAKILVKHLNRNLK